MTLPTRKSWLVLSSTIGLALVLWHLLATPISRIRRPNLPAPLLVPYQPNAPAAPGDRLEWKGSDVAGDQAPLISDATSNAPPGRSVIISGSGFTALEGETAGSDTKVWLYSQTSPEDGTYTEVPLLRKTSESVVFMVPEALPYGLYLVWVENAKGASKPVLINATRAWWAGPNQASPGSRVSVYGRNLSHGNGKNRSHVYLRRLEPSASTALTEMTVIAVNPYRVTFLTPESLLQGKYEIWVHNGHGGDFGWSGPLPLRVQSTSPACSGPVVELTRFGASPANTNDDTAALEAAFRSAKAGETIYLPDGHYRISRPLEAGTAICLQGQSTPGTVLEFVNGSGRAGSALRIHGFPSHIQRLTLRSSITQGLPHETGLVRLDGRFVKPTPAGATVESIHCTIPGDQLYACIVVDYTNQVQVRNNRFDAPFGLLVRRSHQIFVRDNTFAGNWPDLQYSPVTAVGTSVSADVDVSGNRAFSLDRAGSKTLSRFLVTQGHGHGLTYNHYVASNELTDIGCAKQSCGENILIEAPGTIFTGRGMAGGALSVRFDGAAWRPGVFARDDPDTFEQPEMFRPSVLIIQSGKGKGQYRRILGNTSDTISIDTPWDVPPGEDSIFTVITSSLHNAIVYNTITGWPGAMDNPHKTNVGIQAYGSLLDSVISGNSIVLLDRGIEISSLLNTSCGLYIDGKPVGLSGNNCPTWGNLIAENTISNVKHGIASWSRVEDPSRQVAGPALRDNIVRDNTVSGVQLAGITVGDINKYHKPDQWQLNTVVEANRITNAPIGVELLGSQSAPLIRANAFLNDMQESEGIRIERDVINPCILANTFAGMFSTYISQSEYANLAPTDRDLCFAGPDAKRDGASAHAPIRARGSLR